MFQKYKIYKFRSEENDSYVLSEKSIWTSVLGKFLGTKTKSSVSSGLLDSLSAWLLRES